MLRLVFLVCLLFAAVPARAEVFLENLTWMELRDAVASGTTTVIIPVGGVEQSGPQLALGKHNARVKFLAQAIAEKLGHTLVAPVVPYVPEGQIDPPTEHMKYPGTISIPDAAFIQVLEGAARSLRHAGFTHIVIIGDHGGYQRDLASAADALNREWKGKGKALGLTQYYETAQAGYVDALKAAGITAGEIGTHAALADTALELATAPDMVRQDKMKDGSLTTLANGVYGGSPARSSAALGQKGVDLIVAESVAAIARFVSGN